MQPSTICNKSITLTDIELGAMKEYIFHLELANTSKQKAFILSKLKNFLTGMATLRASPIPHKFNILSISRNTDVLSLSISYTFYLEEIIKCELSASI